MTNCGPSSQVPKGIPARGILRDGLILTLTTWGLHVQLQMDIYTTLDPNLGCNHDYTYTP